MDTELPTANEMRAALEAFENALATPLISGKHAHWCDCVSTTCSAAASQLRHQIKQVHPAEYAKMLQADSELASRVGRLREEDAAIERQVSRIETAVERLRQKAADGSDEASTEKERRRLINSGISLAVRARKQEVAVKTWLLEALSRPGQSPVVW